MREYKLFGVSIRVYTHPPRPTSPPEDMSAIAKPSCLQQMVIEDYPPDSWRTQLHQAEMWPPNFFNAEPHVEPQQHRRNNSGAKKSKKHTMCSGRNDALIVLGTYAEKSKEHIDALEKLLHQAMPSKIVLESVFAALRNAVADDIEAVKESHWEHGVRHGEWMISAKLEELERRAARVPHFEEELARSNIAVPEADSSFQQLEVQNIEYAFDPKEEQGLEADLIQETENLLNLIECGA